MTWKANAWCCPTLICLQRFGCGGQEPCWGNAEAQQMGLYLGLLARFPAASRGVWAGHVGFLCTNTVWCQPTLFFGSCKTSRETNFSGTQSLKDSQIPLIRERNLWILSSVSRKDHLWYGFAVFTKQRTKDMFHINMNFLTNLRSHYHPNLKINTLFHCHRISMLKLNLNLFWRRTYVNSVIFLLLLNLGQFSILLLSLSIVMMLPLK